MMAKGNAPSPRRYVRADLLLPGDVFLSRGTDRDSNWIAWATLGPFSHAAIYPTKYNYCLFESSDEGVGFVGLDVVKICRDPGQGRHIVLVDVSHHQKLEIRRHPAVAERCRTDSGRQEVEDRLAECLVPRYGFEYPAYEALGNAVPYLPGWVVKPVLWAIERMRGEPAAVVPGLFCSQLVFEALKYLKAAPLRRDRRSETVSPNTLASASLSQLEVVEGMIVDETFDCQPLPGSTSLEDIHRLQESLLTQADTAREQGYKKNLLAANASLARLLARYQKVPTARTPGRSA
jgi:hypothetical protein